MLIYFDSAVLIYYLDSSGSHQLQAATRLAQLRAVRDEVVISDLVRLECRVHPLRRNDLAILGGFDSFFQLSTLRRAPLNAAVFDRATEIRAQYSLATVDSIHLAAAIESGCHIFLTNDKRLNRFQGIEIEMLD
jgi:predicted nucleic acid-binding protein